MKNTEAALKLSDREMEGTIIAIILLFHDTTVLISVQPEDFFDDFYRIVITELQHMQRADEPIDILPLMTRLRVPAVAKAVDDAIGKHNSAAAFLYELSVGDRRPGTAVHATYYVTMLVKYRVHRWALLFKGAFADRLLENPNDPIETLRWAQRTIRSTISDIDERICEIKKRGELANGVRRADSQGESTA